MASVAEIIHQRQSEIMARWSADARKAASARGLSAPALTNIMPRFLASLADQVETGQHDAAVRRHEHMLGHLATRIRQGFDLAEMIREFHILEACITRAWADMKPEDKPAEADIERMREQIQNANTELADAFFHHMLEDEQAEKRYVRRLQDIANEALSDDRKPLRDRLRDLLEVVVDAMAARSAAFLLFDTRERRLVTTACYGDEVFEAYATSVDHSSFAGQVAGSDAPTSIHDVSTTTLEVPESLAKCGIHSVLGVRIPRHAELVGILYVGIAETRDFTPREIHRLELLADRLALHLEYARLFADLHETIESLHVERGMRERFVAILAHDLRGPLSAARLAADLLAQVPDRLDIRRDLAIKIEHNIERVDRMIRDLLDVNRIRAGAPLPLRLDACDLCALVEQVAEEARAMHGDRFVVHCHDALGVWSADELHRALWNLVTNAVKYGAADQPITLAVSTGPELVRVSVHNLGKPIPNSELPHLFDAFHRTTSATTSNRIGWGLGLTLVRGCAEAHGGHVEVTSDASGTTFVIELPLDATPYQRSVTSPNGATVH